MNTSRSAPPIYLEEAFAAAKSAYGPLQPGFSQVRGTFSNELLEKANCTHLRSDATGAEYLAFRGTRTGDDWLHNGMQVLGLSTKYTAAAQLGRQVRDEHLVVAFAGHSLGGGLAKTAAEAASTPAVPGTNARSFIAVSFNGASVAPATYRNEGLAASGHLRTTYHVMTDTDILTRTLKGGKQTLLGSRMIEDREPPGSRLLSGAASGSYGVAGHKLAAFVTRPPIELRDTAGATYALDPRQRALLLAERSRAVSDREALATLRRVSQHPERELQRSNSRDTSR